jgi:hypothetical protein
VLVGGCSLFSGRLVEGTQLVDIDGEDAAHHHHVVPGGAGGLERMRWQSTCTCRRSVTGNRRTSAIPASTSESGGTASHPKRS